MRAAKEALAILVVLFVVIFPFTKGGCYMIWNASGFSEKKAVEEYLKARGIDATDLQRRALGVSKNSVATFKTDYLNLKKKCESKNSPLEPADPPAAEVKDCKKYLASHPDQKNMCYSRLLRFPPLLSQEEQDDLTKAYLLDDLAVYQEGMKTLPPELKWVEVRIFIRRQSGLTWLFYGIK